MTILTKASILAVGAALGGVAVEWLQTHPMHLRMNSVRTSAASVEPGFAATSSENESGGLERIVGVGFVDVEGGAAGLTLPIPGAVEEVLAAEGEEVRAGRTLIRLRPGKAKAQVAKAEAAAAEAQTHLTRARRAPQNYALQIKQQEKAIAAAKFQQAAAERQTEGLHSLTGAASVPEEKFLGALDQLDAVRSSVEVEELKLQQFRLAAPDEEITLAEAALKSAQAELQNARQSLADHSLAAPRDGVVLRILVSAGQMSGLNPLQPALWFRPNEPLIVRAEIDQAFAGRVAVGMRADIYDDNRQVALGAGRVYRLAPWIAQRRSQLDEPFQRNDVRTLECLVALEGEPTQLRVGQRLRVVIESQALAEKDSRRSTSLK